MASLLLFLRVIVGGNDERVTGEQDEAAATPASNERLQRRTFPIPPQRPATARDGGGAQEEEERWMIACLEWPRVDRKYAWMQMQVD
ncbi:unnamed protein product [Urochloa decumbens]|uniref:Uncharacterized protein n=1 Tax=Urochloa decumbens TaxID=240449 RepID=A0ABC9AHI7_9POAL